MADEDFCQLHSLKTYSSKKDALLAVEHMLDKVEWCPLENAWHVIVDPDREETDE